MTIRFEPELDIFAAGTDAIVNPTNCVGVMGAGLAAQMRQRYPEMFNAYLQEYRAAKLRMGKVFPFRRDGTPRYILCLPTKYHWRDQSDLALVAAGLRDLANTIETRAITSIAIPMVGCGLGGLSWSDVRPVMLQALRPVVDRCEIIILGEGTE